MYINFFKATVMKEIRWSYTFYEKKLPKKYKDICNRMHMQWNILDAIFVFKNVLFI